VQLKGNDMAKAKKIGLVLGSGGARGFCHIGIIEVLQENNIPIDIVTGCSMGAMVAGGLAAGVTTEKMREVASKVTNFTVFDIDIRNIRKMGGFAKGNRSMKLYKQYVGESLIEECEIKLAIIATDLKNNELYVFKDGPIWRAVRASMSIPGLFHPICEDDKVLVDGGLLKRMPIAEARELGADVIIAVDATGPPSCDFNCHSTLKVFEQAYKIIDWKTAQYEGKDADILIVPKVTRSALRFKNNEEVIQAGRDAATEALPQILKLVKNK